MAALLEEGDGMPMPMAGAGRLAIRGDLLDFVADPAWGEVDSPAVRWRPDHWLLIDEGRIAGVRPGDEPPDASWLLVDRRGRLVMPGFIDTHVHGPQVDVIASYGAQLLDWLNVYTFPAERRHADPIVAAAGAELFLDALLAAGTTSAVVYPTVHAASVHALFAAAAERGMRLVAGKVLMDRHAPEGLVDPADTAKVERECIDLIDRWHGRDRLAYAVTVRFAPTSSPAQLAMAGALCRADESLYLQTHLAENRNEVRWVSELFPEARSYLDVYASAGLLHARSVFAHGIWLDDADRAALASARAQIAHCPSSNLFLGSGLFDWRAAEAAGVAVGIGSDVGAGTALCALHTLSDAYKVQALTGERLTAWKGLYAATLGGARALGLQDEIGSLDAGCLADVCVWDWAVGPIPLRRLSLAQNLHEKAFAWVTLGDDRNLMETYVAGRRLYERGTGA